MSLTLHKFSEQDLRDSADFVLELQYVYLKENKSEIYIILLLIHCLHSLCTFAVTFYLYLEYHDQEAFLFPSA